MTTRTSKAVVEVLEYLAPLGTPLPPRFAVRALVERVDGAPLTADDLTLLARMLPEDGPPATLTLPKSAGTTQPASPRPRGKRAAAKRPVRSAR